MLSLKQITKTFNQNTPYEKTLYNGLNLDIHEGDFITVIGSNGAGKSTLFKLISNELNSDNGSITMGTEDTTNNRAYQTARSIAAVVQDPKLGTVGGMTVYENLAMAEMKGKPAGFGFCVRQSREATYKEMLTHFELGLEDKLDIQTKLLSGGQRQVLSILMATMNIPELLLLDEHTAALDPKTSEKVMQITEQVVTENKLTCMMITHKLEDALRFGNRLIMIHEGKVLMDIRGEEKRKLDVSTLMRKYSAVKGTLSDRQIFN
jgi:putative ABC transport system ATP-binding protein